MMKLRKITAGFLRASCKYQATLRPTSSDGSSSSEDIIAEFNVTTFLKVQNLRDQENRFTEDELRRDFELTGLINLTTDHEFDPRASDLLSALKADNLQEMSAMIDRGVALDTVMHQGNTLLHVAAEHHRAAATQILLSANANPNCVNDLGWSPLLIASLHSDVDTVKILLRSGVDTEITFENATALDMARARKDNLMIPLLKSGSSVSAPDVLSEDERNRILSAAHEGHRDDVMELLNVEPDLANLTDNHGNTPLNLAAMLGHEEISELLLNRKPDLEKQNNALATPLISAAQNGHLPIVNMLLDAGANIEHPASNGVTPLLIAAQKDNLELVELLIQRGANVNGCAKNGDTILHISVREKRFDTAEVAIDNGADVNAVNLRNATPLSIASSSGLPHFVRLLIKHGAGSNAWRQVVNEKESETDFFDEKRTDAEIAESPESPPEPSDSYSENEDSSQDSNDGAGFENAEYPEDTQKVDPPDDSPAAAYIIESPFDSGQFDFTLDHAESTSVPEIQDDRGSLPWQKIDEPDAEEASVVDPVLYAEKSAQVEIHDDTPAEIGTENNEDANEADEDTNTESSEEPLEETTEDHAEFMSESEQSESEAKSQNLLDSKDGAPFPDQVESTFESDGFLDVVDAIDDITEEPEPINFAEDDDVASEQAAEDPETDLLLGQDNWQENTDRFPDAHVPLDLLDERGQNVEPEDEQIPDAEEDIDLEDASEEEVSQVDFEDASEEEMSQVDEDIKQDEDETTDIDEDIKKDDDEITDIDDDIKKDDDIEQDDEEITEIDDDTTLLVDDAVPLVIAHCQECGAVLSDHKMRLRYPNDIVVFYCLDCRPHGEVPSSDYVMGLQASARKRISIPVESRLEQIIKDGIASGHTFLELMLGFVGEGEIGSDWTLMKQRCLKFLHEEAMSMLVEPLSENYQPELYRIRRLVLEGIRKKKFLKKPDHYHGQKVRMLHIAFKHVRTLLEEIAPDHPDVIAFRADTTDNLALVRKRDAEKMAAKKE